MNWQSPFSQKTKELGSWGEQIAFIYLKNKGYQILDRNFRCRYGEIDLIAAFEEYLVFVEVKSRMDSRLKIDPLISLTKKKCERIKLLSQIYFLKKNIINKQPRFDVVGIVFRNQQEYNIEHIENAF